MATPFQIPLIHDFTPQFDVAAAGIARHLETQWLESRVADYKRDSIHGALDAAEIACREAIGRRDPCFDIDVFGWRIAIRADELPTSEDTSAIDWMRWFVEMHQISDPQGLPVSFWVVLR